MLEVSPLCSEQSSGVPKKRKSRTKKKKKKKGKIRKQKRRKNEEEEKQIEEEKEEEKKRGGRSDPIQVPAVDLIQHQRALGLPGNAHPVLEPRRRDRADGDNGDRAMVQTQIG